MLALSSMDIAIFPGMRTATAYSCLIQGALPIDEGSQGVVLGCCMWMMRGELCRVRLFGCSLALLLEPNTFINLIHEKFGVDTWDAYCISSAVDSSDQVVLLTISVVNFNGLPLRTHKHIILYTWQLTIRFQFFSAINRLSACGKNL